MKSCRTRRILGLLLAVALAGCLSASEKKIASWHAGVGAGAVTLDEPLFGFKVAQAGVWKHCRFHKIIGFGLFPTVEHRRDRLAVLLLHGYGDSPRSLAGVAAALDAGKFEAVYGYYPTGQKISETAKSMRAAMRLMAKKQKIERMAIVAYSMGGLIARRYLGDRFGKKDEPEVGLFVSLSTPWGGSERGARWTWLPASPPSWKDMTPGGEFMNRFFDRPLPDETGFHMLYGTKGGTWRVPGEDDGSVSIKSAKRQEALDEADSATVFPESDHYGIVVDKKPIDKVVELLDDYFKQAPGQKIGPVSEVGGGPTHPGQ
ncbi:MAG: alpha/beta hydrolase [Pseudomonadota bacterium]